MVAATVGRAIAAALLAPRAAVLRRASRRGCIVRARIDRPTAGARDVACLAALDILEESTELVDRLWENTRYFKGEMQRLGFDTGKSTTPITPVMLGEAPLAQQFSRELFENGVFAMAIGFPTVPRGKARIRVMISASHQVDDLDQGLQAFTRVGRNLGVIQ